MKISFAVIFILVASTEAIKVRYSANSVDKYITGGLDCAKEEGVDPMYISKLNEFKEFPSREEIRCMTLCMIKKFNLLDDEFRFLSKKYLQFVDDPVVKEKLSISLDKCTLIHDTVTSCDAAYDLHKCILENI